MSKVCFGCGNQHDGEDVLCEGCSRQPEVVAKPKQTVRGILDLLIAYLSVIISVFIM